MYYEARKAFLQALSSLSQDQLKVPHTILSEITLETKKPTEVQLAFNFIAVLTTCSKNNYLNFAETRESQKETGSLETVVPRYFAKIRLRVWVDVLAFMKTSRSIISAAWLRRLPVLHLRSSNQVVYLGSSSHLTERWEHSSRERLRA